MATQGRRECPEHLLPDGVHTRYWKPTALHPTDLHPVVHGLHVPLVATGAHTPPEQKPPWETKRQHRTGRLTTTYCPSLCFFPFILSFRSSFYVHRPAKHCFDRVTLIFAQPGADVLAVRVLTLTPKPHDTEQAENPVHALTDDVHVQRLPVHACVVDGLVVWHLESSTTVPEELRHTTERAFTHAALHVVVNVPLIHPNVTHRSPVHGSDIEGLMPRSQ